MFRHKILLVSGLSLVLAGCTVNSAKNEDFTAWDEEKVYEFLYEVEQHVRAIPIETTSKEQIIEEYEQYFAPELSEDIFNSLYMENDSGWKVPDGDAGYIFFVPTGTYEGSEVFFEFNADSIRIRETYEINMYSAIEYVIRYPDNPIIAEWIYER